MHIPPCIQHKRPNSPSCSIYFKRPNVICVCIQHAQTYHSFDEITARDSTDPDFSYPLEFAHSIDFPGSLPEHELEVVNGMPVMLMRNLDPKRYHCNGIRYIAKQLLTHNILLESITGPSIGTIYLLPRITLSPENNRGLPFDLKRRQFPIVASWAISIHKSQGQTFPIAAVNLFDGEVFAHGQAYVAYSRGVDPDQIKIGSTNETMLNVVYPEALID
jgi:ATP-dependent DNA helicase PIF1